MRFRPVTRCFLLGAALLAPACSDSTGPADPRPTLCVGSLGPVSLAKNNYESAYLAAYLALEEANDAGGLPIAGEHYRLVLDAMDDRGSAAVGIERAAAMHAAGCPVIVGPGYSSVTVGSVLQYDPAHLDGVADYAIANHMVLISPSATAVAITDLKDDDYVFRTVASDGLQGAIAAEYAYGDRNARTASIIFRDDAWGAGLATVFAARFVELGGQVLASSAYPADAPDLSIYDFRPNADAAFAGQPDLVYLAAFQIDGAKLTYDLHERLPAGAYHPLFVSADGVREDPFLHNGYPAILEGMIGTFPSANVSDPAWQRFDQLFTDRFHFQPQAWSQQAYDAAMVAVLAMASAASTDPAVFKAAVADVTRSGAGRVKVSVDELATAFATLASGGTLDYDGATGPVELDDAGDPGSTTEEVWEIRRDEHGQLVFATIAVLTYGIHGFAP